MGSDIKILVVLGIYTLVHTLTHVYTCEHTYADSCARAHVYTNV